MPNPLAEPLLDSAGKFADDPFWDDMMDSIRRHRLELDAEWDTPQYHVPQSLAELGPQSQTPPGQTAMQAIMGKLEVD